MQKYSIKIMALNCSFAIDINEECFHDLKRSKVILDQALAIEEKYEIIINNYIELEQQVTNEAIKNMTTSHFEPDDIFNTILALNVKLVNLLSSCYLYYCQVPRSVRECLCEPDAPKVVNGLFSHEYDNNLNYRFMYELRNHLQHNGLAVHCGNIHKKWKGNYDILEYSFSFFAEKSECLLNEKFKKKILNELPDKIDLHSASRSYIESISNVHEQIRNMIQEVVKSRVTIETAMDNFKEKYPDKNLYFLSACSYDDKDLVQEISLSLDWDDIRKKLLMRNKRLGSLGKSRLIS